MISNIHATSHHGTRGMMLFLVFVTSIGTNRGLSAEQNVADAGPVLFS
jgi:hypothetical protein